MVLLEALESKHLKLVNIITFYGFIWVLITLELPNKMLLLRNK